MGPTFCESGHRLGSGLWNNADDGEVEKAWSCGAAGTQQMHGLSLFWVLEPKVLGTMAAALPALL